MLGFAYQADSPRQDHARRDWLWCGMLLVAAACGCRGESAAVYQQSEAASELPENHQQQIAAALRRHFGDPQNPHLRLPPEEGAEEAADQTREEGDANQGPRLVDQLDPFVLRAGAKAYRKRCAACHGVTGDGAGKVAEYLNPRPRDYRRGLFKFASTPRSVKPRREDLVRLVRWGAKGTSMPSFRWLPDDEFNAILDYVTLLSQRGEVEQNLVLECQYELDPDDDLDTDYVIEVVQQVVDSWDVSENEIVRPLSPRPPKTEETIELGRQAFLTKGCQKCHGVDGRGLPEPVGNDDWNQPAYAANITAGMLHGGRRPIDIYRRIYTGINGTPMPGFGEAYRDQPDTLWHLVYYVEELAAGRQFDNSDAADLEAAAQAAAGGGAQ